MTDDNVAYQQLKDTITMAYEGGYAQGRVDALNALSTSMHLVSGLGIVTEEQKKGYAAALETIDTTLKFLQQDNEERGF